MGSKMGRLVNLVVSVLVVLSSYSWAEVEVSESPEILGMQQRVGSQRSKS
ncbi:MAG: hypothetical protein R2827_09570 [Bdellovibrionales bacterium]